MRLDKAAAGQEGDYYRCKLRAVELILDNIADNVETLGRIGQLRNYSSSQSSNSQGRSSACSVELGDLRVGDFGGEAQPDLQQMLSYDQYVISGSHSPQLEAHTLNSDEEEALPLSHSEVFYKRARPGADKENIDSCNRKEPGDKTLSKIRPNRVNLSQKTVSPHHYPS